MIDKKKKKEKHHLERFLDQFKKENPSFSFGNEKVRKENDPKPDFLFECTSVGKLGIEHTEVYQNDGGEKITLQAIESYQAKIVDEAKRIFCGVQKIPPLGVLVWFNNLLFEGSQGIVNPIGMKKENLQTLSQKLSELVEATYSKVEINGSKVFKGEDFPEFKLRDCFFQISIERSVSLKEHRWEAENTTGFSNRDIIYKLQQTICKKNENYNVYIQACDRCWLLIVGQSKASQFFIFTPEIEEQKFISKFERVFYLSYFNNKFVELKI